MFLYLFSWCGGRGRTHTPHPTYTPYPKPTKPLNLVTMVDQVKHSVVRISNLYGSGSGVIVQVDSSNNSALILTNYHVSKGRSEPDVTVYDSLTYRGQITWIDQKRDLGMVSICCMVLNAIPFGNGNDLRLGARSNYNGLSSWFKRRSYSN